MDSSTIVPTSEGRKNLILSFVTTFLQVRMIESFRESAKKKNKKNMALILNMSYTTLLCKMLNLLSSFKCFFLHVYVHVNLCMQGWSMPVRQSTQARVFALEVPISSQRWQESSSNEQPQQNLSTTLTLCLPLPSSQNLSCFIFSSHALYLLNPCLFLVHFLHVLPCVLLDFNSTFFLCYFF